MMSGGANVKKTIASLCVSVLVISRCASAAYLGDEKLPPEKRVFLTIPKVLAVQAIDGKTVNWYSDFGDFKASFEPGQHTLTVKYVSEGSSPGFEGNPWIVSRWIAGPFDKTFDFESGKSYRLDYYTYQANGFHIRVYCRNAKPLYGYIDKTGRLAIDMKYDEAKAFKDGLAPGEDRREVGLYRYTGKNDNRPDV
jgi:hypothetical protein